MPDPYSVDWRIARKGRAWDKEPLSRYELTPEKIEMVKGKLFWSEDDRLIMAALLLENIGVDRVVRLGNPKVWREAIAALDK
jgi:hypothetical protein